MGDLYIVEPGDSGEERRRERAEKLTAVRERFVQRVMVLAEQRKARWQGSRQPVARTVQPRGALFYFPKCGQRIDVPIA